MALSLMLVVFAGWFLPVFFDGAGKDVMTQGILGTLLLVFSAPPLVVAGCILGYLRARNG